MAAEVSQGETYITIVGDNQKPYDQDFVPNNKVMDKLFEYVFDGHPNFMPPEKKEKNSVNLKMTLLLLPSRKKTKFPKLMFTLTRRNEISMPMLYMFSFI